MPDYPCEACDGTGRWCPECHEPSCEAAVPCPHCRDRREWDNLDGAPPPAVAEANPSAEKEV